LTQEKGEEFKGRVLSVQLWDWRFQGCLFGPWSVSEVPFAEEIALGFPKPDSS